MGGDRIVCEELFAQQTFGIVCGDWEIAKRWIATCMVGHGDWEVGILRHEWHEYI